MVNTDWQAHSVTHWFTNRMNYCHVCVWDGELWLTGSLSHSLIHKQNELLSRVCLRWWSLTDRLTQSLIDLQTEWITVMCVFEMVNSDCQAHSVTHWFANRMNYCHVCVWDGEHWLTGSLSHSLIHKQNELLTCVCLDGERWQTGSLSHSLIHKQNELLTCVCLRWWTLTDRLTQSLIDLQT